MNPTKLTVRKDRRSLEIAFGEETYEITSEMLRVMSPSAEVQGHSPDQKITVGGKCNVEIMQMEPVGNYAIRITFDDMHNTGIFTWNYLKELGENAEEKWSEYLAELEDKGMSALEAVKEAGRLRLRPILMTSFAFIMGVLPMAISTGAGAEMRQAMGVAVFSGMIGVTIFGLLLTPVFYVLIRKYLGRASLNKAEEKRNIGPDGVIEAS